MITPRDRDKVVDELMSMLLEAMQRHTAGGRGRGGEIGPAADGDALLTPKEVASLLQVPLATIYNWRHRNTGPEAFRIGRHLRFRRSAVAAWIESQKG